MDEILFSLIESFPDDAACSLLATVRDSGAVVTDDPWGEGWQYTAHLDGRRFVGRGESDVWAARALLLAMGYDPN